MRTSIAEEGPKLPIMAADEESRSEGAAGSAAANSSESSRPSRIARIQQMRPMVALAGDFNLAAGPHDHGWDMFRSIGWECAAPAGASPPAAATGVGKRGSSMDSIWVRAERPESGQIGSQGVTSIAASSTLVSGGSGQVIRFDLPEEREAGAGGRARLEGLKQVSDHFPVCADTRFL